MISLSLLALEVYQRLGKKYLNLNERREATKNYILNEITQWTIKKALFNNMVLAYKPLEFQGTEESTPFEVRLILDNEDNVWELKFGNLNAETDEERFKWDNNDPMRLQKSLFLRKVLETEVIYFIENGNQIKFTPYNGDGLGDDRYSYFYNMFSKLNKNNKFTLVKNNDTFYIKNK